MAMNTGQGYRKGPVRGRSQVFIPKTGRWTKRDAGTGQFADQKADQRPFKGVSKESTPE
jgi:hypothetical protein